MTHDVEATRRTHRVWIPEGEIVALALGRGRPVLFLHGVSARARTWLPVAERVADRARAWLPDLLSRGESSTRPDVSYDLDSEVIRAGLVADALARLDAGGGEDATDAPRVLVGHSHGAAIALALAAERPGVEGLVLSNPVSPWVRRPRILDALASPLLRRATAGALAPLHRPFGRLVLARAAGPHHRASSEQVGTYAGPYADRRRAEALMRVLSDWRPAELGPRLPSGRAVRIVTGAHDPRISVESARRLASLLDASFTVIEDGGHILPEQHPDALAREILTLLDDLDARAERSRS